MKNETSINLKQTAWITAALTALATGIAAPLLGAGPAPALWVGAGWGLANFWVLDRLVRSAVSGSGRLRLFGWLALKLVGLYGGLAWLLVAARISPLGWLAGFTLSLIALGVSRFSSIQRSAAQAFLAAFSLLTWAGWARASEAAHGASEAAAPAHPPEIPNFITLITHWMGPGPAKEFLHTWENSIYALGIAGGVGLLVALAARTLAMRPGRAQMAAEAVIEGVDNMVCGVLGKKEGRRYLPFLGTLFLYILAMNLAGLVPGLKSPTSRFEMTGALGLTVFCFVQWTGLRRLGFIGYADHMIGQPRDAVGWILSPLMLFIHGIGEIVKPLSLSLRLFGNIMGEDTLLGVFVALGALTFAWSRLPIGIPLHLPFMLLAIIFSVVQALVFTMLTMIYIYMMLPHEEH